MPLPQQSCAPTTDVCCVSLFEIATFILNTVYDKLIDCMPPDCNGDPMELRRYVTMGNGDDAVMDSLTVAFQGATPTPRSKDNSQTLLGINAWKGMFEVRLRESGWPMARSDGNSITPPDPVMQQAMARHAYAHGEQMFRIMRNMASTKKVVPANYPQPSLADLTDLRTLNPSGGAIGFVASLIVELPWGQQGR